MAYIDFKSSYYICVTYILVHRNFPYIHCIDTMHKYIYSNLNSKIKRMWMIYSLPICLSHVSIWIMFFSNTRQHFLHPCLLQPLSVILICYDLCSMFDFVIQYSLPPKVRVFLEVLSIHYGIWWHQVMKFCR
jgi:hypothetical protein